MSKPSDALLEATRAGMEAGKGRLAAAKAMVGFDGFVDEIIHVVDKRESAEKYTRLETMTEYAARLASAAGKSCNMEWVVQQTKLGGNGPIMANALGAGGVHLTYIGALGHPRPHPVFAHIADYGQVHSIVGPAVSYAVEFLDAKVMYGKMDTLREITLENIIAHVGEEQLKTLLTKSDLIAFVNWCMTPYLSDIWRELQEKVLPACDFEGKRPMLFFDLADPEKRLAKDIEEALELIGNFRGHYQVVLGVNEREAQQVCDILGGPSEGGNAGKAQAMALHLQQSLDIHAAVVHPTAYAAAATGGKTFCVPGPYTPAPKLTTGAGDNFNAGFCLGQLLGLDIEQSLVTGVCASGFYVRNERSGSTGEIQAFIKSWAGGTMSD